MQCMVGSGGFTRRRGHPRDLCSLYRPISKGSIYTRGRHHRRRCRQNRFESQIPGAGSLDALLLVAVHRRHCRLMPPYRRRESDTRARQPAAYTLGRRRFKRARGCVRSTSKFAYSDVRRILAKPTLRIPSTSL